MTSLPLILPENSKPKVSVGDKVTEGQIIAQKKQNNSDKILPVAQYLGITPKETLKSLRKRMGDRVEEGDLLAEKKGIMNGKKLFSPFSGTVYKLEEESGDLYIKADQAEGEEVENVLSPVEGKVTFCDNTKIVIESDQKRTAGIKASEEKEEGEIVLIDSEEIDYNDLPKDISGKVVLGKKFDNSALYKAVAMGALGIVCSNIQEKDFEEFREKSYKVPLFRISSEDFEKLAKSNGKKISLESLKKIIIV